MRRSPSSLTAAPPSRRRGAPRPRASSLRSIAVLRSRLVRLVLAHAVPAHQDPLGALDHLAIGERRARRVAARSGAPGTPRSARSPPRRWAARCATRARPPRRPRRLRARRRWIDALSLSSTNIRIGRGCSSMDALHVLEHVAVGRLHVHDDDVGRERSRCARAGRRGRRGGRRPRSRPRAAPARDRSSARASRPRARCAAFPSRRDWLRVPCQTRVGPGERVSAHPTRAIDPGHAGRRRLVAPSAGHRTAKTAWEGGELARAGGSCRLGRSLGRFDRPLRPER